MLSNEPNWDWPEWVFRAGRRAALNVWKRHRFPLELEDLEQESAIYIATHEDAIRKRLHRPRYVQRRVEDRLHEYAQRESRVHGKKEMSYEEWAETHSDEL
ncbi:hypothetical protein ACIOWF_05145 [Cellulosimicrobium cellulans]|uniref:hypothetical protein n=1 Tax=Cellulosimicrobium cellulans TaxID=1710 RepID=UPI003826722D